MTSWVGGPRRSSKALPKAKRPPKKRSWSLLVVCFWSDPLQLSESRQNYYIWEVCSANQWDALKSEMPSVNWTMKFCLILHIHLTFTNQLPLLQASQQQFSRENASTTSRMQKMLSKSSFDLEAQICMLQEETNISHWKNCVDCNGSHFD